MKTFQEYLEAKIPRYNCIPENHPVRAAVVDIPTYWKNPDKAISYISEILDQDGFTITDVISFDDKLPDYQASYHLADKTEHVDSQLVFTWHLMDSGRYEVTAYLS